MELDVSKKVRTAIKAKLMELGVHVDEELPDYIMILIANRRSKSQMEDDLGLFLGDNTMKFSSWLHQVLKKLQEVTTSGPKPLDRQPSVDEPESKSSVPMSNSEEGTAKKSTEKTGKSVERSTSKSGEEVTGKRRHSDDSNDSLRTHSSTSVSKKLKTGTDDEGSSDRRSSPVRIVRKEIKHVEEPVKSGKAETSKVDVVALKVSVKEKTESLKQKETSKRPISPVLVQPLRSLIVRKAKSPPKQERSPPFSRKRRFGSGRHENDRGVATSNRQEAETRNRSRSRSTSPTSKARKSLRSLVAVVKRHNELNAARDEDTTQKKKEVTSSVASVVRVTSRPKRDAKPAERGSNKLLFRALADAQRSIASHSISKSAQVAKSLEKEDEDSATLSPPKEKSKKLDTSSANDVRDARQSIRSSRPAVQKSTKSIKDRLGYRVIQRVEPNDDNKLAKFEKKDQEQEDEEYVPTCDDSLKTIIINIPVSRAAKSRMVTLEDKSGSQGLGYQSGIQAEDENVNRLSIQVKNDSDTSDEDEEDDNDVLEGSCQELQVTKKQEQRVSSTSVDRSRVGDKPENKATGASDEGSSDPDNGSQDEEIEIEEYEEVEEDDDEYEYEVVLQEKNATLPDPDDEMSSHNDSIPFTAKSVEKSVAKSKVEAQKAMKASASNGMSKPAEGIAEVNTVHSSAMSNSYKPQDGTKFVVTMDTSEAALQSQAEEMDTTPITDLRQRITRSVVTDALNASGFAPLTSSGFNYNRLNTPVPPPANCKYWPDCQFKDKCIFPHPKCKYASSCTKPDCPYKHDGFAPKSAKVESSEASGKIQCKFFPKCHSMSCQYYHPSPCRFGVGCTDIKCLNFHPGPTLAQQRSQGKMTGSRPMYRPALPAAHLLRWKAPAAENSTKDAIENVSVSAAPEV